MGLCTPLYTTRAHSSPQILRLSQWGMGSFKGRWMILLLRTKNWGSSEYPAGRVHSARPAPVSLDAPAQAATPLQLRRIPALRLGPARSAVLQPHLALGAPGDLAASSCALPPSPRERALLPNAQLLTRKESSRAAELSRPEKPVPLQRRRRHPGPEARRPCNASLPVSNWLTRRGVPVRRCNLSSGKGG